MYAKQTIFPAIPIRECRLRLSAILAILALFAIIIAPAAATTTQLVALQGRVLQSGSPATSGSIAVTIWSNGPDSGSVLYSDNFANAISDGFFDVMLGASSELNLTFGNFYHLDMSINGQDINWTSPAGTTVNRIQFQSRNGGASMNLTDTSSATILYVNSTSGNVGIGTTEPLSKFHIKQTAAVAQTSGFRVESNVDDSYLFIGRNLANPTDAFYIGSSYVSGGAYKDIYVRAGNGNKNMILQDNGGNVGLGTATPNATLDVAGGIRLTGGNSTCGVNNRGELRYAAGGANVDDLLYWCAKNSTNIYNWVLISRGG